MKTRKELITKELLDLTPGDALDQLAEKYYGTRWRRFCSRIRRVFENLDYREIDYLLSAPLAKLRSFFTKPAPPAAKPVCFICYADAHPPKPPTLEEAAQAAVEEAEQQKYRDEYAAPLKDFLSEWNPEFLKADPEIVKNLYLGKK